MSNLTQTPYDTTDYAAAYAERDAAHKAEKRKAAKAKAAADLASQLKRLGG